MPLLLPLRLDALPRRELLRLESEAALSFEVIFEVFNLISTATLACASFLERRASSLSAIVARHTGPVQSKIPLQGSRAVLFMNEQKAPRNQLFGHGITQLCNWDFSRRDSYAYTELRRQGEFASVHQNGSPTDGKTKAPESHAAAARAAAPANEQQKTN